MPDLPDVGISSALPLALFFSAFSMLRLFALPYGWGDHDLVIQVRSVSMFCNRHRMDLGPLCTPAVL
jgi:hypothetical protein